MEEPETKLKFFPFPSEKQIYIDKLAFSSLRRVVSSVGLLESPNICFLFGYQMKDGNVYLNECISKTGLIASSKSDILGFDQDQKIMRALSITSQWYDQDCPHPVCCPVNICPTEVDSIESIEMQYHQSCLRMRKELAQFNVPIDCIFAFGKLGFISGEEPIRIFLPDSYGGLEYTNISIVSQCPSCVELQGVSVGLEIVKAKG